MGSPSPRSGRPIVSGSGRSCADSSCPASPRRDLAKSRGELPEELDGGSCHRRAPRRALRQRDVRRRKRHQDSPAAQASPEVAPIGPPGRHQCRFLALRTPHSGYHSGWGEVQPCWAREPRRMTGRTAEALAVLHPDHLEPRCTSWTRQWNHSTSTHRERPHHEPGYGACVPRNPSIGPIVGHALQITTVHTTSWTTNTAQTGGIPIRV